MQNDLISRSYLDAELQKAQESLESSKDSVWERNRGHHKGLAWARNIIQNAPAIDAAQAAQGRWLPRGSDDNDTGMYYCSACKDERYFGDEVITGEEASKYCPFCPNCGAKMDDGRCGMMPDLKPCPFCGSEAEIRDGYIFMTETKIVTCKSCFARTIPVSIDHPNFTNNGLDESTRYTPEQAAQKACEMWNRRVDNG